MEKNTPRKLITIFSIIVILLGFVTNIGTSLVGAILLFMNWRKMNVKKALMFLGWLYLILITAALVKTQNQGIHYYDVIGYAIGLSMFGLYFYIKSKENKSTITVA